MSHKVNYLKESNSKIHELKNNNKFIRNGSKRDDKLTVSNSSYNNNNNNNINCYNYKNKDKDKEREIYILKKDLMSNNNNNIPCFKEIEKRFNIEMRQKYGYNKKFLDSYVNLLSKSKSQDIIKKYFYPLY